MTSAEKMRFNGSDYSPALDDSRLSDQHLRVKSLMKDGVWRTLKEIAMKTGDPEASISAQLRHLRKPRFGAFTLEKRARGDRTNGLFEYRLTPPGHESKFEVKGRRNRLREALEAVWRHDDTTDAIRDAIREAFK